MPQEPDAASAPAPAAAGRPILSVLIVTYRSRHEIGECLESIPPRIHDRAVEILVADNHSDDGTIAYVRERFPAVRLLALTENCGFSKANNLALADSSGETILFLNPDTVVTLAALQACLDRLATEPEIGIISPRLEMLGGEIDPACRRSIPTIWDGFTRASGLSEAFPKSPLFAGYNLTYLPEDGTYDVGAVNGAFMMITRRVLNRVGPLDEQFFMYGEDLDFCYRCKLAGYRVVYDGRHSIIHYKGRSSAQNYRALSRQIFTATEQFYQKHFNPKKSLWGLWKYRVLLRLWYVFSRARAAMRGHKMVRPA
jgi:N-acetylglucosaminyl-diphospho-decaprenol L-rhamnosyltransferase